MKISQILILENHRHFFAADTRGPWDETCLEASDDARVWHVYNEEATKKDAAITDGCNRNIDVLLVFVSSIFLSQYHAITCLL